MTSQLFNNIIRKACERNMQNDIENFMLHDSKDNEFSSKLKRRMNRLFRVHVGGNTIPHPEVDNWFERLRAKIIKKALSLNFKPIIRIK